MSLSSALRRAAAPTALAVAAAFTAANAYALDLKPGQCLPTAEMMAKLKAEGQKSVVVGNRVWGDEKTKQGGRLINVFTSDSSGTYGVRIEGDAPLGEPSQKFCFVNDYTEISLYDARGHRLPETIPQSGNFAATVKNEMDRRDLKPMMVSKRNGVVFVVSGNPDSTNPVNGVIFVGNSTDPNRPASTDGHFAQLNYSSNIARDKLPSTDGQAVAPAPSFKP